MNVYNKTTIRSILTLFSIFIVFIFVEGAYLKSSFVIYLSFCSEKRDQKRLAGNKKCYTPSPRREINPQQNPSSPRNTLKAELLWEKKVLREIFLSVTISSCNIFHISFSFLQKCVFWT